MSGSTKIKDKDADLDDLYLDDEVLWDSKKLGADEKFAKLADPAIQKRIEEGLGLQQVTLRLPKAAIAQLKILAKDEGLGYQPLIRQLIMRFLRDKNKA